MLAIVGGPHGATQAELLLVLLLLLWKGRDGRGGKNFALL